MEKYKRKFKKPLNFNVNSPQGIEWKNATIESHPYYFGDVFVCHDPKTNSSYVKYEKHQVGVIHTRIKGGKWEPLKMVRNPITRKLETFEELVVRAGLQKANFKGGPRPAKR